MTVADHIVVGEVGFAAWKSSDALQGSDLGPDMIEEVRRQFMILPSETKGDIHVARRDGVVVGWCARDGASNYVSDLWVDPGCQGRGIGKALLSHVCDVIAAESHATATIQTHAKNAGAIRLYQRCGFAIVWRGIEFSKSMNMDLEKVHLEKPLG